MTALAAEILALIRQEGPISIERYMELALGHPTLGYYMTRDPFGRGGDFTTAPEVSQMFGELIGLWVADAWDRMGRPPRVIFAEAGPGRGTLMADMLRALCVMPGFRAAAEVHLIETSSILREVQRRTLAAGGVEPVWSAALDDLPADAPLLLVANEFLDALPIRQFVRREGHWRERLVGERDGRLAYGLAPLPERSLAQEAPEGSVLELAPAGVAFMAALGGRISRQGGAALVIDYGHAGGFGDTLQAMSSHRFIDPLAVPGEADLTAHVDFAAMARAATAGGVVAHGPVRQGELLRALGLAQRAERLIAARPDRAAWIAGERDRLTDMGRTGMGRLFLALALTPRGAAAPPGFG